MAYTGCLKKPAPFSIFYYGRNYWRKYLKICHKYIQLINKQFPNFLCPNCNRFFSTSVFPRSLKNEPVRATAGFKWMQIGNFSINYQIIHIQGQNNVKFNTNNHIFLICCVSTFHSQTKASSWPRTVQSSGEPLFRVMPETAWTTEGKGRGGALLGHWFSGKWI